MVIASSAKQNKTKQKKTKTHVNIWNEADVCAGLLSNQLLHSHAFFKTGPTFQELSKVHRFA